MLRRTMSYGGHRTTAPPLPKPRSTDDNAESSRRPTKLFFSRGRRGEEQEQKQDSNKDSGARMSLRRVKSIAESGLKRTTSGTSESSGPRRSGEFRNVVRKAAKSMFSTRVSVFKGLDGGAGESGTLRWGAGHMMGRRPYMEDRFLAHTNLTLTDSVFGIFDGHGGDRAAQFCIDNLPGELRSHEQLSFNPEQALIDTFEKVDQEFCQVAKDQKLDDGTTAVVCLIRGDQIWCANAGDSRCVMSRDGVAMSLSEDHKPNRADERERITNLGGFVKHLGVWRTQGVLAVSRAIGDLSLKKFVVSTPDVVGLLLTPTDQFLVLASDGLWDVMNNQEVVDFLHKQLNLTNKPEQASRALVAEAFRRGSCDNIAVVVVTFHNKQKQSLLSRTFTRNSLEEIVEQEEVEDLIDSVAVDGDVVVAEGKVVGAGEQEQEQEQNKDNEEQANR